MAGCVIFVLNKLQLGENATTCFICTVFSSGRGLRMNVSLHFRPFIEVIISSLLGPMCRQPWEYR